MMRVVVLVLLAVNALFFAWSRGWLDRVTGLPAHGGREPQRLAAQQHPERIQPLAASSVAAMAQRSCLELGPLEGDAALAAAQAALKTVGAEAVVRSSEETDEGNGARVDQNERKRPNEETNPLKRRLRRESCYLTGSDTSLELLCFQDGNGFRAWPFTRLLARHPRLMGWFAPYYEG
ncbi:MAG: hypothetical protein EOP39_07035, partial [Rubrivivax sp.]